MDMRFFYAALAIMAIVFLREFLRRRYGFDMDNVNMQKLKALFSGKFKPEKKSDVEGNVIKRTSGEKSLYLADTGANKATVMATLRQITGVDYNTAKNIVNAAPGVFMTNVSEKEADLTKKALEFVGAKVEIR